MNNKPDYKMSPTNGPLKVHPDNPRYFSDKDGNPVYLTGSHTWANIQDFLDDGPDGIFDLPAHLAWLCSYGHNYTRGWHWEQATWSGFTKDHARTLADYPLPFARTGPGTALDGKPKFDLTKLNDEYFTRLRERCIMAGEYGIYISIMLFEGFSVDDRSPFKAVNPWDGHPFNIQNNINGIDGTAGTPDTGRAIHTLHNREVTRLQEAYVKRVVDTVNDLDNILYEIGNEHYEETYEWQCHLVRVIKEYQAGKPNRHPVGMTSGGGSKDAVTNTQLYNSPADWISPRENGEGPDQRYCTDPPANDGAKVVIADTDHLWGLGGTVAWVWKSVTRGLYPALMDPYTPLPGLDDFENGWGPLNRGDHPLWDPIRKNMGDARKLASGMDLKNVRPAADLCSTGYCLAVPEKEFLAYIPDGGRFAVNIGPAGEFIRTWLNPDTGECSNADTIKGNGRTPLIAPYPGHAVMYLRRK